MNTQVSNPATRAAQRQTFQNFQGGLRGLTSLTLLLCAGTFLVQQILIGHLIVPLVVITAVLFATAVIVQIRQPWTPLLGSSVLIVLGLIYLAFTAYGAYHLTHPEDTVLFVVGLVTMSSVLVGIVTGIGATWSSYVPDAVGAPKWLPATLGGLVCLVLVSLLYVQVTQARMNTVSTATSTTSATGMAEVRMSPFGFEQTNITVPVNGMVHLTEAGPYYHVVANGTWSADGKALREVEPGAPLVSDIPTNGAPIMIGPFTQAGVFHYFCPIHPNMSLTVTVT